MVGRIVRTVRWGAVLGFGAVWWWAVLRLASGADTGVLEDAVAAGGWGLSLLPVHCVPKMRAAGAVGAGRWVAAWQVGSATNVTTASPRPRWGAGSDPS
ncbi:hypothetical protein [Streptomyces sp. NPDC058964]|uniref:hypothetical protein n=1 Tax=Streptomyces sp. NPDC058964 TaxID=3346681 RepID=UPI0036B452F8